jgi:Domain of unknown function (DUF4276)
MIVDGQAEFRTLRSIFPRIRTRATLMGPLWADLQPGGGIPKIVRAASPALKALASKGAQRILILLDHENRPQCVPTWRAALEAAFDRASRNAGVADVKVVLKVRMYENWLISDPAAIKSMPRRFNLSNAHESQIAPDRADRADALHILKTAARGVEYHKVRDAMALMAKFDPYVGAGNSRSFRRFLRLLGCNEYAAQSRVPEEASLNRAP